jgi:hypothetical protein
MSAETIGYILWPVGPALQASICVYLWRKNLRARYPLFFSYCAFMVLSSVALFIVSRVSGTNSAEYFYAYWSISAVRVGLGFTVIYELFRNALQPYHALRDLGSMLFGWAGAVMLLVAVLMAMNGTAPNDASRAIAGVLNLERSVRLAQCGLLLFLLLFGSRLGLTLRHRTFGIAAGVGIYAATDLLFVNLRALIGPEWAASYSLLRATVFILSCGIWLYYVVQPEPAPVMLPSMAAARPILQRWDEALAEASAGYSSGAPRLDTPDPFTSTVEKTVERVLRKEINDR